VMNPPMSTTTQIEAESSPGAHQSSSASSPIVTGSESAIPQASLALTTHALIPSTELTPATIKTTRLSIFAEAVAIALVLIGLTAIVIILRRRRLLRKD